MSRDDQSLYVADGSNLDVDDWSEFCARAGIDPDVIDPLCCAVLPDMRLCFDDDSQTRQGGASNIRPAPRTDRSWLLGHACRHALIGAG